MYFFARKLLIYYQKYFKCKFRNQEKNILSRFKILFVHIFFQSLNVLPPSKDLISKLIPILFKVSKCITYSCGEQFIIYKGLSQRTENHDTTVLNIPGSCTATTNECQELNISCWREYIVNDEPFKVSVTFGSKETVIKVRDDSFRLSFLLPPSQDNADGMIFNLERLQICRGYLSTNSVKQEHTRDMVQCTGERYSRAESEVPRLQTNSFVLFQSRPLSDVSGKRQKIHEEAIGAVTKRQCNLIF